MAKSPKRRAWLRWSIAACLVFLLLLGWELASSMKQLNALEADRQAAQEQLGAFKAECERLGAQADSVMEKAAAVVAERIIG